MAHTVFELQMALEDKARGQHIANLRKRKRLTQQAMAERLKVAYRTYQTWEAGTMPEWDNLERLSKLLGVKPEDIIGDQEVSDVDQSQFDRIETRLDEILARLDEHGFKLPTPREVGERAARRRAEKPEPKPEAPRKSPAKRRVA